MSNLSVAEEFISTKINKYSIQLLNTMQKKKPKNPQTVLGWSSRFSFCLKNKPKQQQQKNQPKTSSE